MTESALEFLQQTPPSPGQVGVDPSAFLDDDEEFTEDDPAIESEEQSASEFLRKTTPPRLGGEKGRQEFRERRERVEAQFEALEAEGVDVETGGPAGVRAELSLTPPERKRAFLVQAFGEGNFRDTPSGVVVKINDPDTGDPREILLDERGLTFRDFADAAEAVPVIAGAIGGTLAAIVVFPELVAGGVLSLLALAVISGVSGQLGGATTDVIQALKTGGIDMQLLESIAKRRGINAAIDTTLDFLTAGTFRLVKGGGQIALGPFSKRLAEQPQKEIGEAAERLGVDLTPGQATGSPTVLQAEAVGAKIPGAREVFERLDKRQKEQLRGVQEELTTGAPTSAETGEAISRELTGQRAQREAGVEELRREAGQRTLDDIDRLSKSLATRSLSTSESGELTRRALQRERTRFRAKQTLLEDHAEALVDELPETVRAFATPLNTKTAARELINEFPKQKIVEKVDTGLLDATGKPIVREETKTKAIKEFFPPEAKKFLFAANKLSNNISVNELRKVRGVISRAIQQGESLPGLSTGMLKKLAGALTRDIKAGAANAPTPEIKKAILDELAHFRVESAKFRNRAVARAFREEGQPGFTESQEILPGLLLKNKFEDAARVIKVLGPDSIAVKAAQRSTFDEILQASKNTLFGEGAFDPKLLARQLDKLRPQTKLLLFGTKQAADEADTLTRALAARFNIIDLSVLEGASGSEAILPLLRRAAQQELDLRRDFDNDVIKPILRGEVDTSTMNPEDFVRFALRTGSQQDLDRLFKLLPQEQADAFRKRTVIHLLERSARRGGDPADKITSVLDETTPVGDKLLEVIIKDFGQDTRESLSRLRTVLGDDTFQIIKDLGTVQAARARGQTAAKAAGGLVGGSIIANFLSLEISNASRLVKFKIVAEILRLKPVRVWLTRGAKLPDRTARSQTFQLVLPQITEAVTNELGEESEAAQEINKFFRDFGDSLRQKKQP